MRVVSLTGAKKFSLYTGSIDPVTTANILYPKTVLLLFASLCNSTKPTKFVSFPKYEYFIADIKYANLAKRLGLPCSTTEEAVNSLIRAIQKLNQDLGEPRSLQEAGINEQEFLAKVDELADKAFSDQCTSANPRVPLIPEIKQILIDSYYGNEIK